MGDEHKTFWEQTKDTLAQAQQTIGRKVEETGHQIKTAGVAAVDTVVTHAAPVVRKAGAAWDKGVANIEADVAKVENKLGYDPKAGSGPNPLQNGVEVFNRRHNEMNDAIELPTSNGKPAPETAEHKLALKGGRALGEAFQETFGYQLNVLSNPKSSPVACAVAMAKVMSTAKDMVTPEGAILEGAAPLLQHLAENDKRMENVIKAGKFGEAGKEALEDLDKINDAIKEKRYGEAALESAKFAGKFKEIAEIAKTQPELSREPARAREDAYSR
jgi:hypothetical protein